MSLTLLVEDPLARYRARAERDPEYRARYEALLREHGNPLACAVWAEMDVDYSDSAYSREKEDE